MLTLIVLALSLLGGNPEPGDDRSSETKLDAVATMRVTRDIKYIDRPDSLDIFTSLDVYQPTSESQTPRPILIYIHGGGWAIGDKARVWEKPEWAFRNDWVLVSVNYRLSPDVMHPEHARDVAAAIAYVHKNASRHGADSDRIVIMGHSAGAHLAGIVATDETLLGEYGLGPSDLKGVVLLDGAGYNIPNQMESKWLGKKSRAMFEQAFGLEPELWVQASPTLQAQANDELPPLLAVYVPRLRARLEAIEIVRVWNKTGAQATRHLAPDKDHATINRLMGKENDPDTQVVESFICLAFDED